MKAQGPTLFQRINQTVVRGRGWPGSSPTVTGICPTHSCVWVRPLIIMDKSYGTSLTQTCTNQNPHKKNPRQKVWNMYSSVGLTWSELGYTIKSRYIYFSFFYLVKQTHHHHFNLSLNVTTLLKKKYINIYSFENTRVNKSLEFITYLLY